MDEQQEAQKISAVAIFDAINEYSVLELEQRLRKLNGEVEVTKQLLKIVRARHKASRAKAKSPALTNGTV